MNGAAGVLDMVEDEDLELVGDEEGDGGLDPPIR